KISVTVGTPAKKVVVTGNHYVAVGKTTKLKATVTPKNASNKKVVWSTSNKKIATVSSSGIVKGIKAGKATITATASDGSGKKAKFNIYVKEPVEIESVSVINMSSIKVVLKKAQKLSDANFKIYDKLTAAGSYNHNCSIDSIVTNDNKTYIITLDLIDKMQETQKIKVTVTDKVSSSSMEATCASGGFTYNNNEIICTAMKDCYFTNEIRPEGQGVCTYSVKNLPAGINYSIKSYIYQKYIYLYGTPTKAGVFTSNVSCKDELGNTYNYIVKFAIGDTESIAATSSTYYFVTGMTGMCSVTTKEISTKGGSGQYKYSIDGEKYGLTINAANGAMTGTMNSAGTYNVKVRVTDANDSNVSTVVTVTIKVAEGCCFTGVVKDLRGDAILNSIIYIYNKDKGNKYCSFKAILRNGFNDFTTYIPAGTYDIMILCNGKETYFYNLEISGSKSEYDFKIPLYRINVECDSAIDDYSHVYWYDESETNVGMGDKLYLKPGTYKLHTEEYTTLDGLSTYKATAVFTVNENTTRVKASMTINENAKVIGSVAANNSINVIIKESGNGSLYYKFEPTETRTYYFYTESSFDTVGRLVNADKRIVCADDNSGNENNFLMSYECQKGSVYYIGISGKDDGGTGILKVSKTKPTYN
ncbi:MAG: Ig-like domain-containing protein, partial [Coprococcus sp.]